jgi:hypothetical protein
VLGVAVDYGNTAESVWPSWAQAARRRLQSRYLAWQLALLALLLCAPALWSGLQMDDYTHRASLTWPKGLEISRSPAKLFAYVAGDPKTNRRLIGLGGLPWWTPEGLRMSFCRPLAGLSHGLDYQFWPNAPWLMHLHSLIWFAGVVVVATLFYRRILGATWVAGLAALLFALDDAHGWPVVWLANRNALLAVFFGLLTLMAHDRWRRGGRWTGAFLAPAALLAALLSKESAVATGAYLLAYALFLDRGVWPSRLRSLVPCALTGVVWWAAYKHLGYGVADSGVYVDPGTTPLRFLGAVFERGPILLLGQWAFPWGDWVFRSDMRWVVSEDGAQILWLAALGFLLIVAAAVTPLLRRDATARFWTVGMVLAVVPACTTSPSDRLLFFVGIGGMGLLAQFVAAVVCKVDWSMRSWRRLPTRALCVLLAIAHLVCAPVALARTADDVKRAGGVLGGTAAATFPTGVTASLQTVLVVNVPSAFLFVSSWLVSALSGKLCPMRALVLGSSIRPVEIHRADEYTLLVRPEGGFLALPGMGRAASEPAAPLFDRRYMFPLIDRLYCGDRTWTVGQRLELGYVTIEVTALTEDGRPARAEFRFSRPLESRFYRWIQWDNGAYVSFPVPAVGDTVTLPAVTSPDWLGPWWGSGPS